jgi:cytidylate kinase
VAAALGALYFDTGCLYRALSVQALERGVQADDGAGLAAMAAEWELELAPDDASALGYRLRLGGEDLTGRLRDGAVDATVSRVSAHPAVRAALLERQREIARTGRTVLVGRDTGTVVVPDAECKVFLVASPEERARRRYRELLRAGRSTVYRAVLTDIERRDQADAGRAQAPMAAAPDAVVVDTTAMSEDEVVDLVVRHARSREVELGLAGSEA